MRSALRAAAKRFERNPPKAGSWREMSAERFIRRSVFFG